MAFQILDDGALAVIEMGGAEDRWTNTLWFTKNGFTTTDMQELADDLHDWFGTNVMPEFNDIWYLKKVTVYDMRSSGAPLRLDAKTEVQGGVTGSPASVNAAAVITFYTDLRGRSFRGRNYLAGFDEADQGSDTITNATRLTNLETAYGLLISAPPGTGWTWKVASRYANGAERPQILATVVESVDIRNNKLGSQRRRVRRA